MNHVERFRAVMDFQPVDRLPRWEWAMWWDETITAWKRQGLPHELETVFDIAQYFAGRAFGRHQLAPRVSPKKTVEGLVGGVVVSLLIGAALHFFPPFDLASGLAFGAIVAVFAPLGDLAVSVVKRSLDVKDMGTVLPGHGGLLDRIDGLMFVIPAAWVLFEWLGYI